MRCHLAVVGCCGSSTLWQASIQPIRANQRGSNIRNSVFVHAACGWCAAPLQRWKVVLCNKRWLLAAALVRLVQAWSLACRKPLLQLQSNTCDAGSSAVEYLLVWLRLLLSSHALNRPCPTLFGHSTPILHPQAAKIHLDSVQAAAQHLLSSLHVCTLPGCLPARAVVHQPCIVCYIVTLLRRSGMPGVDHATVPVGCLKMLSGDAVTSDHRSRNPPCILAHGRPALLAAARLLQLLLLPLLRHEPAHHIPLCTPGACEPAFLIWDGLLRQLSVQRCLSWLCIRV